jgi:GT2 family glycosyltransferase
MLAIVVVNYSTSSHLRRNLVPLSVSTGALVVVVDSFSTPGERDEVRRLASAWGWVAVEPERNLGFAAGVNAGARAALDAGATELLLLNPDASLTRDDVEVLHRRVLGRPMALVSPVVRRPDGTVWFDGADVLLSNGRIRSRRTRPRGDESHGAAPWLSGACLMVSSLLWRTVGGFDEEYFMYWEDVDLSARVLEAGGGVLVEPAATAVHDEGGSQEGLRQGGGKSALSHHFNIRNRLLYAARHLDAAGRRRWRRTSLAAAYRIVRQDGRRHLLSSPGLFVLAASATAEGLRLSRIPAPTSRAPVVMMSLPPPRPTSNPYGVMLVDALRARHAVDVRHFSWRRAYLTPVDVFHAHWPETMLRGGSPLRSTVKRALFAGLLLVFALRRTAWVRTVHNVQLPRGLSRTERLLLRAAERRTVLRVLVNASTSVPVTQPSAVIPHGHYAEWFDRHPRADPVRGRILFFGAVRGYKNVPALVTAFRDVTGGDVSLHVAGNPTHPEHAVELERLADGDPRIALDLRFLPETELVREVTEAELVVLPYPEMHNSGSVLAALSLQRPVLVPDNEVNRSLSSEVGERWVHRFTFPLGAHHLEEALGALRGQEPVSPPCLGARSWERSAALHEAAYRRALALCRGFPVREERVTGPASSAP